MPSGGARQGAGRKKGSPNKASAEREAKTAETGETPRDYMLRIMRDDTASDARRDDMAKAVAAYTHPKLSAVRLANSTAKTHEDWLREMATGEAENDGDEKPSNRHA